MSKKEDLPHYFTRRGAVLLKSKCDVDKVKEDLTVTPKVHPDYGEEPVSFKVYLENKSKLYLPKFYLKSNIPNHELNMYPDTESIDIKFTGQIRDNQKDAIDACMNAFNTTGGGILQLGCGFGKTVIALYLISQLKVKTMVIVHKSFLLNQWKERIEQFLPDARVGIVQGPKIEVEDKDIVIGMIQSLSTKKYPPTTFDGFGFLIADECHHCPCRVFSRAIFKLNCPYMLGLSATPNRSDGLTKVLKWFIGDVIYSNSLVNNKVVKVQVIEVQDPDRTYQNHQVNFANKPNRQGMIGQIVESTRRNKLIVNTIMDIMNQHDDRRILLLSDRRKHLEDLHDMLCKKCSVGFYMGGIKQADLDHTALTKDVILGTYNMAAEAMDIPKLNTLILATPKPASSAFIQSVGRIDRKVHEIQPIIVDLVDFFSVFKANSFTRSKYYKKRGFDVTREKVALPSA